MTRRADVKRQTAETSILVSMDLDGTGKADIRTGIGFFDHMLDQIARSVRAASQESKDIADSAHLMVDTMQKQSARTQEMVVTVQQMSDLTSHNADQTVHAAEVAGNARQHASAGGQVMDEAVRRLDEAGQAMSRSAAAIESLERRSNEVSGIAQLIGEIADQTNLLALNAAIEAARAGEMGRGFAVVADEVRKLAERTGQATTEISQMIDGMRSATGSASSFPLFSSRTIAPDNSESAQSSRAERKN